MKTLLIDGDGFACRFGFAHRDPAAGVVTAVRRLMELLGADRPIVCLSCRRAECFRRAYYPQYKANRDGRDRPAGIDAAVEALRSEFPSRLLPTLEADDLLGILATGERIEGDKVVVSSDSDLLTIPGDHFDPTAPERGVTRVSEAEADRNFYSLILTGKPPDFPGCPGVGPAGAKRTLAGDPAEWWDRVVLAFKAKRLTEADAMAQARVARILRAEDFLYASRTVIPWEPERHTPAA